MSDFKREYQDGDLFLEEPRRSDIFRKSQGMRLIRKGLRECLHCEREFYSVDLKLIKMCDPCRSRVKEEV